MIRVRFFGPGELIQRYFSGAQPKKQKLQTLSLITNQVHRFKNKQKQISNQVQGYQMPTKQITNKIHTLAGCLKIVRVCNLLVAFFSVNGKVESSQLQNITSHMVGGWNCTSEQRSFTVSFSPLICLRTFVCVSFSIRRRRSWRTDVRCSKMFFGIES